MVAETGTIIIGEKIRLRSKSLSDAQDDYRWQSDTELANLDAAPPLDIGFKRFLMIYTEELKSENPFRRQFAIETLDGKHIGNCVIYGINEEKAEAELGIMIGEKAFWDKGYGADTVMTLLNYVFRNTSLNRIYLKTLENNRRAQRSFRNAGFSTFERMAGDKLNFILMEIYREEWERRNKGNDSNTTTN